jgi:hypothetical protein
MDRPLFFLNEKKKRMRNLRTLRTGWILAILVFWGVTLPLKAEEAAPSLKVIVREESGNVVPSAGQIEMRDTLAASNVTRTAAVNREGIAFFPVKDFMGFTLSGMTKDGEMSQVPFDGKSPFPQSGFQVLLTLSATGYASKETPVHVSAESPTEYTFMLGSGGSSSPVQQGL